MCISNIRHPASHTNNYKIQELTINDMGHTIHHNNVFSKDDTWIVFDGRNDDTKIGETSTIGIVNTHTGEEKIIYQTHEQTVYGPGVGAASFSPVDDRVIFIHGLANADSIKPYDMSRRVGVGIDVNAPNKFFHYDARDTKYPYTTGSLRGGTHSHCWSADGRMISFTYNDEFVDSDLRLVGVMVPVEKPIIVGKGGENNDGNMFSAIVTEVVREPRWGSDEISKAFDECWVGSTNRIAFQGHTRNAKGDTVTEIYLVDIDEDMIKRDKDAVGQKGERPHVPQGIRQIRLSRTDKGLSDLRHWLRSSPDGRYIYALAKDEDGRNQIVQCNTQTGEFVFVSAFDFSVNSPINISYKGDKIAFFSNNNVYVFDIESRIHERITAFTEEDLSVVGAPVFSRKGDRIAFNQFVSVNGNENIQIKLVALRNTNRK